MTPSSAPVQTMHKYWALVQPPQSVADLNNRGVQLLDIGNASAALTYFDRAIASDPANAISYFNRGQAFAVLQKNPQAINAYELAVQFGLDTPDLHHNLALTLFHTHRPHEALTHCNRALRKCPDALRPMMLNTRSLIHSDLGHSQLALDDSTQAVQLDPLFDVARLNRAVALLMMGHWQEGWKDYESRWSGSHEAHWGSFKRIDVPLPLWTGQTPGSHDALLVVPEQGVGDTLQFCRYLQLALKRFERVGLACPAPLWRVLSNAFGSKIQMVDPEQVHLAQWQWHCPMLSLPLACLSEQPTPYENGAYLLAEPDAARPWREELAHIEPKGLRVGLVWCGSAVLKNDVRRSIAFEHLKTLLDEPGVTWISLQKSHDKAPIYRGQHPRLHDWTDRLNDFADTAGLIDGLDLVIAVDTAVAHLAAAMGKPVWLLNRFESEWRWMRNQDSSHWYPSMRLFNQRTPGDWRETLVRVAQALRTQG